MNIEQCKKACGNDYVIYNEDGKPRLINKVTKSGLVIFDGYPNLRAKPSDIKLCSESPSWLKFIEQRNKRLKNDATAIVGGRKYCGYEMPHPQCDDACMYACTEGGKFPPKCNTHDAN